MSHSTSHSTSHTAGHHGSGGHDAHTVVDHSHHTHTCTFQLFFGIYVALLFLTFITVAASRFDFGSMNMVVAMAIAAVKASLVMTVFMHLKWDTAMNNIAFLGSLIFLSLLFLFTIADVTTRGVTDPIGGQKIQGPLFGSGG